MRNVQPYHSDGSWGLKQFAPFDAIVVTAAPDQIPESLLEQLAVGGKLIIPVGPQNKAQKLIQITRTPEQFEQKTLDLVSFVPLREGAE